MMMEMLNEDRIYTYADIEAFVFLTRRRSVLIFPRIRGDL